MVTLEPREIYPCEQKVTEQMILHFSKNLFSHRPSPAGRTPSCSARFLLLLCGHVTVSLGLSSSSTQDFPSPFCSAECPDSRIPPCPIESAPHFADWLAQVTPWRRVPFIYFYFFALSLVRFQMKTEINMFF